MNVTPSVTSLDPTGKIVTLTVPAVVATAADQSVVYSVSYKTGAPVAASPYIVNATALVVDSVTAITTELDAVAGGQLEFAINGGTVAADVAALTEAGYTVEFQATDANVTAGGVVDGSAAANFEYKVVVLKDDALVAESALQEVTISDFSAVTSEITKVELAIDDANDDVIITSGKAVVGESLIFVTGEGTLKDGTEDANVLANFTYKSSDMTKAVVNSSGVITPISAGQVTITVTDGDVTYSVPLTVVDVARAATAATFDKTSVRVINSSTSAVVATVVDQYGDPVKNFDAAAITVLNASNQAILAGDPGATAAVGTVTITFTGNATNTGTGTISLKNDTVVIGTLPVEVGTGSEVASRTIEFAGDSESDDYGLDLNVVTDDTLEVVWNQYNASNMLIGPENAAKYSVVSSNTAVATVGAANITGGSITVTGVAAGTTTISIKEGTITRATFSVTVIDTTPVAASIQLAEDVTSIVLGDSDSTFTFADIASNFVVMNQFNEEFTPADAEVMFFTDDASVLTIDNVTDHDITLAGSVDDTATLIVKVNGHVVSVPVVITDTTAPVAPTVSPVDSAATVVTGTGAEAGATVTVYDGEAVLGTATAETNGTFSVTIEAQDAGAVLTVTVTDAEGNESTEATVTVSAA